MTMGRHLEEISNTQAWVRVDMLNVSRGWVENPPILLDEGQPGGTQGNKKSCTHQGDRV